MSKAMGTAAGRGTAVHPQKRLPPARVGQGRSCLSTPAGQYWLGQPGKLPGSPGHQLLPPPPPFLAEETSQPLVSVSPALLAVSSAFVPLPGVRCRGAGAGHRWALAPNAHRRVERRGRRGRAAR